jgi:pilus assembly protein CpaB
MGKWRAIIPITFALVVSLIASLLIYQWLQTQTETEVSGNGHMKPELNIVAVAVAAEDLPFGQKIQPKMVKVANYLKESLPPESFSDPALLEGRVVMTSIKENEPIIEHRLAPKGVNMGGVSAIVKTGKRAIAVKGDKVIGISGFIQPGNQVDVLVTVTDPQRKSEVTKVVLEKILVLATGTLIQEDGKGKTAPVDVYTLEVTPEEGENLALAAAKGKLQFALRNTADSDTVITKGATIPQLLSSFRAEPPIPKVKKRSVQRPAFIMEVIKDGKVNQTQFKQ